MRASPGGSGQRARTMLVRQVQRPSVPARSPQHCNEVEEALACTLASNSKVGRVLARGMILEAQTVGDSVESNSVGFGLAMMKPGTIIDGQLELLQLLGEGATSFVFRARHFQLDREVAVKILRDNLASDEHSQQRFKREQRLSAELTHPGLVKTYFAGITGGGVPYLVMDLLKGQSLAVILAEGRLKIDRFFALFEQVIEALEYLHQQGLVHRDLKPSNIMVEPGEGDSTERAILIDYGLFKEFRQTAQNLTTTGAVVGTSLYMSPEQCVGGVVDARSDIYSLGCVMYESLTGRPPFTGETSYEVMFKQLNESLSGLQGLKGLPKPIASFLSRCLKKSPEDRFADMQEVKESFRRQEDQIFDRKSRVLSLAGLSVVIIATIVIGFRAKLEPDERHGSQILSRNMKSGSFKQQLKPRLTIDSQVHQPNKDMERLSRWLHESSDASRESLTLEDFQLAGRVALSVHNYPLAEYFFSKMLQLARKHDDISFAQQNLLIIYEKERRGRFHCNLLQKIASDDEESPLARANALAELTTVSRVAGNIAMATRLIEQAENELKRAELWDASESLQVRCELIALRYRQGMRAEARALLSDSYDLTKHEPQGLLRISIDANDFALLSRLIDSALKAYRPQLGEILNQAIQHEFDSVDQRRALEHAKKLLQATTNPNQRCAGKILLANFYARSRRRDLAEKLLAESLTGLSSQEKILAVPAVLATSELIVPLHHT